MNWTKKPQQQKERTKRANQMVKLNAPLYAVINAIPTRQIAAHQNGVNTLKISALLAKQRIAHENGHCVAIYMRWPVIHCLHF